MAICFLYDKDKKMPTLPCFHMFFIGFISTGCCPYDFGKLEFGNLKWLKCYQAQKSPIGLLTPFEIGHLGFNIMKSTKLSNFTLKRDSHIFEWLF
jgi:hypothetical protein